MIDANDVEPMPDGGAALLDAVLAVLVKFVVFASDHQAVAVTLWVAATHCIKAWQHATRLVITSPQKRCGKSRLMDIVAGLSFSPLSCGDTSPAAIYRSIGDDDDATPTLFIDEADAAFGTKRAAEQNEELRALLNSGWQRDRPTIRCVGPRQIPTPFNTFAMACLAAIGRLPDTIADRAVNIDLRRRGPGEKVARFRIRRHRQQLTNLSEQLTAWVRGIEGLADMEFDMRGVEDRALDAWEPLVAIADAAGGDWRKKARTACRALTAAAAGDDDDVGTLLLGDIRKIFASIHESFLPSNMLVGELRGVEESPWGDEPNPITASKLAKLLKPYGVTPGHNPAKTVRGYAEESFRDAFRRYLRPDPSSRPRNDSDQPEHEENEDVRYPSEGVRNPSESVCTDDSGRLTDTSTFIEEERGTPGHGRSSDVRTGSDGYPGRNGVQLASCPCGRPAPVSSETGLCQWCELAASKQDGA